MGFPANMRMASAQQEQKVRSGSLDVLRAAAILLFIFYHVLVTTVPEASIPPFLRYDQGPGLMFGDLIAPAFSFILGAALFLSYSNSKGGGQAFFRRKALSFMGIVLLGFFLDSFSCGTANWQCVKWGVLQWLGAGGLLALLAVSFPASLRLLAFALLLVAYTAHNSIIAAFPLPWKDFAYAASTAWQYGSISIFGSVAAGLYPRQKPGLAILASAVLLAGLCLSQSIPIDKAQGSLTFVIVTCAIPALLWCILSGFDSGIPGIVSFISRHSLVLWVLQYALMWWPMSLLGLWGRIALGFPEGLALSIAALPIFVIAAQLWAGRARPAFEKMAGWKKG